MLECSRPGATGGVERLALDYRDFTHSAPGERHGAATLGVGTV